MHLRVAAALGDVDTYTEDNWINLSTPTTGAPPCSSRSSPIQPWRFLPQAPPLFPQSNYRWTAPPRSLFQAPCDFFPNTFGTLYPTSPSSLPPHHPSLPSTDNHAKQEAFVSPLQPSTYTLSIPELAGHKKILKLQLKTAFPIKGTQIT